MSNPFFKDVSILVDNQPISTEFHLYEVGYEKCRPAKATEYAPIDYWVLHYCVSGEGYFSVADSPQVHLTAGDLFLIPANYRNKYYPNRQNPWNYLWIGFSGSLAKNYLEQAGLTEENPIIKATIDKKTELIFSAIYQSFKQKEIFEMFSKTFSLFNYLAKKNQQTIRIDQREKLFLEIKNYLDEHFSDGITVTQAALANNIDRTYLFKLFQKYQNENPSLYIQQLKLDKACSLLRKSSFSITEISYQCGFSSPSYFSKFFQSKINTSPVAYRSQFTISTK